MARRQAAGSIAAAALILAAAAWWLWRPAGDVPARPMPAGATAPHSAGAGGSTGSDAMPARSAAAGDHRAIAQDAFFAQSDLRHRLEALLLEAGEAPTPDALKARLPALVDRHFGAADAARALALLQRYVDYRVALGALRPPSDPGDARALRQAMEARQQLRARHFDTHEHAALFADEDALDRYTLARLEIERHPTLTPAEKQAALRQAESELPDARRALRREAVAHLAVAAQTAAFDAQGVDAQMRHAQRAAQHGAQAADALAQLDREERDWHQRLDRYAAAQAAGDAAALERLRASLFSPQEQLRLDGAMAMRAGPGSTR